MRDLAIFSVLIALSPLLFISAFPGVLIWTWTAMISINELLFGFMNAIQINKIVAILSIALILFGRDKKDFYLDDISFFLILFCLIATISWILAIVPSDTSTNIYTKLLKSVTLGFAIMYVIHSRLRLDLLMLVICLSIGFYGAKEGLISILTAGGHKIVGSWSIGDNNSLATAILMIIPILYYLSKHARVRFVRLSLLAVLALSVITVIMTFSRGGFIGLVILGGMMVFHAKSKFITLFLVLFGAALIYQLAPDSWFSRLQTIEDVNNDSSFLGRVVAWKISLLIALDNPFFGGGPRALQMPEVWSLYRPFLDRVNFIETPFASETPFAAHSIYFEVLGDLGFTGLAIFLLLLALAYLKLWKMKRLARRNPSLAWASDLARMMQVSLVIYAVTGAALSMAYFELVYIYLAVASRSLRTARLTIAESASLTVPDAAAETLRNISATATGWRARAANAPARVKARQS